MRLWKFMKSILNLSQGIKVKFGDQISTVTTQDWVERFFNNLVYPRDQVTVCNMPQDR